MHSKLLLFLYSFEIYQLSTYFYHSFVLVSAGDTPSRVITSLDVIYAIASIVSMGLTPKEVGSTEPSAMNKSLHS